MRKILLTILLFTLPFTVLLARGNADGEQTVLTVYCYDSFASDWGPGPLLAAAFEEETGIRVDLQSTGDAGTVLTQLIMEKDSPRADMVIGLDNNLLSKARKADILLPHGLDGLPVPEDLMFDETGLLIPYDFGTFAICYDTESGIRPPASLEDLTSPEYEKQLILMDPRTSSPGYGFLLWTIAVYGEEYDTYWQRLKPSILTIPESWEQAYGLFLNGEAPLVLSYSTSPAYHMEYEGSERYRALPFADGHYAQTEGMGLIKGTDQAEEARLFMEFILRPDSQLTIALTNIMFPVNPETVLPASFDYALKTDSVLMLEESAIAENESRWLSEWSAVLTGND